MCVLRWVFPLDLEEVSYETLALQTLTCEFFEEVSYETLVLET